MLAIKGMRFPIKVILVCTRWYAAYPLSCWRMDEAYIKVKGTWNYRYRAVDKDGKTIDFLLTVKRDKASAKRFFDKAMQANGVSEKVTIDKSGANKTAIDEINVNWERPLVVRQAKYLNNIVEQDHRAIKRITRSMLGFKSFQSAKNILAAIGVKMSFAEQFYALAE